MIKMLNSGNGKTGNLCHSVVVTILLNFCALATAGAAADKTGASLGAALPLWWQNWGLFFLLCLVGLLVIWRAIYYMISRKKMLAKINEKKLQIQNLKEIDELKSRFFDYISHEFRTPLSMIIGPVEELAQQATDKTIARKLDLVKSNASLLLKLVNQILELSKLEAKSRALHLTFSDLAQFVHDTVDFFASHGKSRGLSFDFHAQPETINTFFDRDIITKVMYNLLSNAVKFTMPGGRICVTVALENQHKNKTESASQGDLIKITVSDTGVGIPAADLPFIFDRFSHARKPHKRPGEGIGLGLCLVKELLRLHQGDITVESIEGHGASFTVTLVDTMQIFKAGRHGDLLSIVPEEEAAAGDLARDIDIETIVSPVPKMNPALPTALIIEDNDKLRAYLADFLGDEFSVLEAGDGNEGLNKAKQAAPDIVICDIKIPGKSGYEVTAALKSNPATRHIPVILLTANAEKEQKIKGLELGADDFIVKPFSRPELLARMKNLLSQRMMLKRDFSTSLALKPNEIVSASADQRFLENVLGVIEAHIDDENFSVDELAVQVGLSPSQLSRRLNALLKKSTVQVVLSVRLLRAAELLKKNSYSIAEVAYRVGFNNPAYFAQVFRKQFNCTPKEYAQRHKKLGAADA